MDKAKVKKKALAAVVRRTVSHAAPDRAPWATDELRPDAETPSFEPPPDDSPREDSFDAAGEDSQVDSSEPDDWLKSEQPTAP
jgi:hypothetical protein